MPNYVTLLRVMILRAILLAIQSFSRVCTPDVMQVILKGILDLGTNIALQTQEKDITAVTKSNHTPLTGKRRMGT
ncbi:hypothetical protein TcBrA4_0008040 [Trypanosoma cruzi]|nr:hypothetical protein TcBrA4_0008040 [Trypanosoma cruzi]